MYFGARYYDPTIGRFITQDPSGMIDGPNLYVYVGNDPVNLVDYWGLCGVKQINLPTWAYVIGGITIATPIPGDEMLFWTTATAVTGVTVLEFSKYNKKSPL